MQLTEKQIRRKIYNCYANIRNRCYTSTHKDFHRYGGRGVTMCDEWKNDFDSFRIWALENGWEPNLRIDKDILYNKKHGTKVGIIYNPEYCCFVTPKDNSNQREVCVFYEYKGQQLTLSQICEIEDINRSKMQHRIESGMSLMEALAMPTIKYGKRNTFEYYGEFLSMSEISKRENVSYDDLKSHMRYKNVYEAIKYIKTERDKENYRQIAEICRKEGVKYGNVKNHMSRTNRTLPEIIDFIKNSKRSKYINP